MKISDEKLNELFHMTIQQTPVASFEEISERFSLSVYSGSGMSLFQSISKIIYSPFGGILFISFLLTGIALINNKMDYEKFAHTGVIAEPSVVNLGPIVTFSTDSLNTENSNNKELKIKKQAGNSTKNISANSSGTMSEKSVSPIATISSTKSDPENNLKDKNKLAASSPPIRTESNETIPTYYTVIKNKEILFTITETSTETDFRKIAKRAKAAGIDFHYQVHHQRIVKGKKSKKVITDDVFLVRDFKINMAIDGTDHSSQISVIVPKWGKFEVSFGWFASETGKATALTKDINITAASSFYSKSEIENRF